MGFPDMSSEDTWHCYGYSIFKQGDLGMAGSLLQKWELSLFKKKKKKGQVFSFLETNLGL